MSLLSGANDIESITKRVPHPRSWIWRDTIVFTVVVIRCLGSSKSWIVQTLTHQNVPVKKITSKVITGCVYRLDATGSPEPPLMHVERRHLLEGFEIQQTAGSQAYKKKKKKTFTSVDAREFSK